VKNHQLTGALRNWRPWVSRAFGWALIFCGLAAAEAQVSITYQATNLADTTPGQDLWNYSYNVSGFSFAQSQGFTVFFDQNLYTLLQSPPPTVSSDWNAITVQPDLALSSNGFYDAQATRGSPSLSDPFSVNFVWLGTGIPGAQPFTVYDANFSTLVAGNTASPVPEPASTVLLFSTLLVVCGRRSGQRRGALRQ